MKIAFISYEYPPDTARGGIATYVQQAAQMLARRGHQVEVFAASPEREGRQTIEGIAVHRVRVDDGKQNMEAFVERVGQRFAQRHQTVQFDVLEAPEYQAEARGALRLVPDIPLVIKLHTPSFVINELNWSEPSWELRVRRVVGALRRGEMPKPFVRFEYDPQTDIERSHILEADEIASPSQAIADRLIQTWGVDPTKVSLVPLPYNPSQDLLAIPIDTHTQVITFIGRLEQRKGILDLAQAIPLVLRECPQAKFRFVGAPWPSPRPALNMRQYIETKWRRYRAALEFTGSVPYSQIPSLLAKTDLCVFPSLWESYGMVCLEAMAAGRGVIASCSGGMAELLNHGEVGRLIPPRHPKKIAEAIVELLQNRELRMKLGKAGRDRVLSEYNSERIGALQEASYQKAIERRHSLGGRAQQLRI